MRYNKKEMEEAIEGLSEQVEFYKKEVSNLNSSIGGYKTSNENYKKHVKKLEAELLNTKEALRSEISKNDELSEKNGAKILELNGKLQVAEKRCKGWEESFNNLKKETERLENELKEVKSLPWYKKIFIH